MDSRVLVATAAVVTATLCSSLAGATTPADRCEARKQRAAGAYAICRARSYARGVIKGVTRPFFRNAMSSSAKSGSPQRTDFRDCARHPAIPVLFNLSSRSAAADVALQLSGGTFPQCGDGVRNLSEQCDGNDLAGQQCAAFGFLGGNLTCSASCTFDVSQCGGHELPATGQTTVYVIGDDGDVQSGSPLAFVDNGDGTITDLNTRLMSGKKGRQRRICASKDMNAVWDHLLPGSIWQWIAQVNSENGTGFAGHAVWRLPECERTPKHRELRPRPDSLAVCGNIGVQPRLHARVYHQRLQLHRPLSLLVVHNRCEWNRGSRVGGRFQQWRGVPWRG